MKSTGAPASLAAMILARMARISAGSGSAPAAPAPYISSFDWRIWKFTETPKRRAVARSQSISPALSRVTTALRKKSSPSRAQSSIARITRRQEPAPRCPSCAASRPSIEITSSSSRRIDVDLLRDEEAVGHHRRPHAEAPGLVHQLADVGAEERLAAEELDAHRPQPRELGEELPVLGGGELRVLAVGRVAVDAAGVAAVQERVLDEERPHGAGEPRGEDLGADAELLRGLHRVASPRRCAARRRDLREGGRLPPERLGREGQEQRRHDRARRGRERSTRLPGGRERQQATTAAAPPTAPSPEPRGRARSSRDPARRAPSPAVATSSSGQEDQVGGPPEEDRPGGRRHARTPGAGTGTPRAGRRARGGTSARRARRAPRRAQLGHRDVDQAHAAARSPSRRTSRAGRRPRRRPARRPGARAGRRSTGPRRGTRSRAGLPVRGGSCRAASGALPGHAGRPGSTGAPTTPTGRSASPAAIISSRVSSGRRASASVTMTQSASARRSAAFSWAVLLASGNRMSEKRGSRRDLRLDDVRRAVRRGAVHDEDAKPVGRIPQRVEVPELLLDPLRLVPHRHDDVDRGPGDAGRRGTGSGRRRRVEPARRDTRGRASRRGLRRGASAPPTPRRSGPLAPPPTARRHQVESSSRGTRSPSSRWPTRHGARPRRLSRSTRTVRSEPRGSGHRSVALLRSRWAWSAWAQSSGV